MDAIPVHVSPTWQSAAFMVHSNSLDLLLFGIIHRHRESEHFCVYLNVDKESWFKVDDALRDRYRISYEGIESSIVNIPNKLLATIPVTLQNFWIGTDYMEASQQPTKDEMIRWMQDLANEECWSPYRANYNPV